MCELIVFQKRDANIKQIPAFKPIPADNASPEKGDNSTVETRVFKVRVLLHTDAAQILAK